VNLSYDERASSLIRDLDVGASNINLVEEKENLSFLLEKKIGEGGFVASPPIQQKWKAWREDQLSHFLRFKAMVTDYMQQETDRR
jgi:hypothetical protein